MICISKIPERQFRIKKFCIEKLENRYRRGQDMSQSQKTIFISTSTLLEENRSSFVVICLVCEITLDRFFCKYLWDFKNLQRNSKIFISKLFKTNKFQKLTDIFFKKSRRDFHNFTENRTRDCTFDLIAQRLLSRNRQTRKEPKKTQKTSRRRSGKKANGVNLMNKTERK